MITSPTNIKRLALEFAKANRSHPFSQVGKSFTDAVEANARAFLYDRIRRHPSKGKTLK